MDTNDETKWKFFLKPHDAWKAMLEACEKAEKYIYIEQFIIKPDAIGRQFIEVLKRKAEQGVKVSILCDAVGSWELFGMSIDGLKNDINFELIFFNSFIPWSIGNHTSWFFRDHRKITVIDGKIGYIGGVCISNKMHNWRDTHIELQGKVVEKMTDSFKIMRNRALKLKGEKKSEQKSENIIDKEWNYITNAPLPRKRYLYGELMRSIREAKERILLTTPYFSPDRRLVRYLKRAARRGLDVKLIIPYYCDNKMLSIAARCFVHTLLKSGVKIYYYKEEILHAKSFIIDNIGSVGSLNLDEVSFRYNFESNIVSFNSAFTEELSSHFYKDIDKSEEIKLSEWKKRPFREKIMEALIRPLTKFL